MPATTSARWCVTANFQQFQPGSRTWLERALVKRRPAVVFGQEMPDLLWLEGLAGKHGYQVVSPGSGVVLDPRCHVVSWLLIEEILQPRPVIPAVWDLFAIHESYAAAARVAWPGVGDVIVVSMHASPHPSGQLTWTATARPRRLTRSGPETRHSGEVWYSDFFLNALNHLLVEGHVVLAAGDLSETRNWDDTHPGRWGEDFFANVAASGLVDGRFRLGQRRHRPR
jgi:hypothetical protein